MWRAVWVVVYLVYLTVIAVFAATGWAQGFLGGRPLGARLEFASWVALIIATFISLVLFVIQKPALDTPLYRLRGLLAAAVFVVGGGMLLDTAVLQLLPMQGHVLIVLVLSLVLTLVDWGRHMQGAPAKDEPVNLKATLVAADIPLVVGLAIVVWVALSQLPIQRDKELFLGGALALKLAFYYGSFCLVNGFLPLEQKEG
jgi:hypothetical protein